MQVTLLGQEKTQFAEQRAVDALKWQKERVCGLREAGGWQGGPR